MEFTNAPLYLVRHDGNIIPCAVCDDDKATVFQHGAGCLQELLGARGTALAAVRFTDGRLDQPTTWPQDLFEDLTAIDTEGGNRNPGHWRLFTRVEVALPRQGIGLIACGVGSNQRKLQRAAYIALIAAAQHNLGKLPGVQLPIPVSVTSFPEPTEPLALADAPHEPALMALEDEEVAPPPPPPPPQLASIAWLGGTPETDHQQGCDEEDQPESSEIVGGPGVDDAKARLVTLRRKSPGAFHSSSHALRSFVKNPQRSIKDLSGLCQKLGCWSEASAMASDLEYVVRFSLWKDSPDGENWAQDFINWVWQFSDLQMANYGRTATKQQVNWRWYFGSLPSPWETNGIASERKLDQQQPKKEDRSPSPPPPPPGPPPKHLQKSFQDTQPDDVLRRILEAGLKNKNEETLTITSLTSEDTVCLGTDLDPNNGYRNLWAAKKVNDPITKMLLAYNLGARVIDAANVGYSFGREVLNKDWHFAVEGVRKAVMHYRKRGLKVVVVCPRKLRCIDFDVGVETVIAEGTDDVILAKKAFQENCPIVSRDNFKDWKADRRLPFELRKWLEQSDRMRVRFSWSKGEFMDDFDLNVPVLKHKTWIDL